MKKKNINVLNIAIGILVFLVLILIVFLFNRNNNSIVEVPSLVLLDEHVEVVKNNNVSLKMVVQNVTNPYVTWASSDPLIASVNSNGVVSAHKEGMTIVTAEYKHTDGKKYEDSCIINVIASSDVLVTSVSFISEDLVISRNSQLQLKPIISPSNASSGKMAYSSSDNNVVSVSNDGVITTKMVGNAVICVTVDGKYRDEINVNVVNESGVSDYVTLPYQLSFESNSMSIVVGDTNNLSYRVSPSEATNKYLIWASSNSRVVSVTNGVIKALGVGEATITVTSLNGVSAKINITVVSDKISVIDVSLTATETEINKGETLRLFYRVFPENATNKLVSFTSSDENVATVDDDGNITAKGSGTTNISITTLDGNHTRTVPITVTSSGGSAKCDDGYGSRPGGACSAEPILTLDGRRLHDMEKIPIKKGQTISITLTLPTSCGTPTLLTRTNAWVPSDKKEYISAHSEPFVNRYDCLSAQTVSSYQWVITGLQSTGGYVEISQTAEMMTTQYSFVKPMISVLIKVE